MEELFNCEDGFGNSLVLVGKHLSLCLGGGRPKNIGTVSALPDGSFVYRKIVKLSHVFRADDSWGVNYAVLERLGAGGELVFKCPDEGLVYRISAQAARKVGGFKWFKTQGFERQFFIPRRDWEVSRFGM